MIKRLVSGLRAVAYLRRMFLFLAIMRCDALTHAQTSPPTVTVQPRNPSVSLGANVTFRATASGTLPLMYQWRFNDVALAGATNSTLTLSNISLAVGGGYVVAVTNVDGAATSSVATLNVDSTFTKITTGLIATEGGDSSGCAWGDFDNDGWPDLFVGNGTTRNFLYRNNCDGTFTKLTNALPAEARYGGSWADYDNDGWLDLFAASPNENSLYRNQRDGRFVKVNPFAGSVSANSWSGSWADYDRDGWIDLSISNGGGNNNVLLHNNGDGTFTRITTGRIVLDGGATIGATWQDYDRDGWPDLYAAN
ncbi:MAG TPA: FG-GAP-like repeat-containing protein, partial [Candidatus Eisenbacteria bacterium]|nr:FG-GAP-like repeat-containing protein [Candidatus Eisenbacteria bacterium]